MKNIFIDMDGVLTEYRTDCTPNDLKQKDYFLSLKPEENMLAALSMLIENAEALDLHICVVTKVYPTAFKYSVSEKLQWRDQYMPYLFDSEFIMVDGEKQEKSQAIEEILNMKIDENCILIDDYNHNLADWSANSGTAVKFVNKINDRNKSFVGNRISYNMTPLDIYQTILRLVDSIHTQTLVA